MFSSNARAASIPIDDFSTVQGWTLNEDGGGIGVSQGKIAGPNGEKTLQLDYSLDHFPWGNAKHTTTLPPNATGVEFDVYVNTSGDASAMHVWMMEADGDGYVARVQPEASLNNLSKGWHHCFVPIGSFNYEARGNGKREILTVNKLMLGLNYANTMITVANLSYRIANEGPVIKESKTVNLMINKGSRGNIAILKADIEKSAGYADPNVLSNVLTKAGFGVTLINPGDMSDPTILTKTNFDCVVFPYGPCYPYAAADTIKAYLKSGGSFVSMGGYAFDKPIALDESGVYVGVESTMTAKDIDSQETTTKWLNTRVGTYGDTMGLKPDQIGVFDPCYPLEYVTNYRAGQTQLVIPAPFKGDAALTGYSACSLLGSDSPCFPEKWGRHIPLIQGLDQYGRIRGDVGSIAHNYAGPYAGSSWVFFGITNANLFAENEPLTAQLPAIVDSVIHKVYLHSLKTDIACYKNGEKVKVSCSIADLGNRGLNASLVFHIYNRSGKAVFTSEAKAVRMKPGSTQTVKSEFAPKAFTSDLYRVTATLISAGKPADTMETGFASYDKKVTAAGFDLKYKNNYFYDKNRPVLLTGTNQTGMVFYSGNENPLVWDRDLAKMQNSGVNVMRVLHFSPFMHDDPNKGVQPIELDVKKLPLKIERQLDAMVQLCQKHKVVLFLSIHDWMRQDLSDKELIAEKNFAHLISARYKGVPGIMIDIQNEPAIDVRNTANPNEIPDVLRDWNDYLKAKYQTDAALKLAWRVTPPESALGTVPYSAGTDSWDDVRTFDAEYFRQILLNKWLKANADGSRSADPNRIVTVGLLPDYGASNKLSNMENVDFANMHNYSSIDALRTDVKLFDRRFEGKSISIGEFGSMSDHDRRANGQESPKLDYNRYLQVGHYLFGMGGSFIENWDWKEMDDAVFPWGINYQCGGPAKSIGLAYRNQSLLMRQIKPEYKPAKVFMVVPLDQMMGGKRGAVISLLYKTINSLYSTYPDFGIIDDKSLSKLPESVEALIYPVPYSVPDEAYKQLKAFVQRGGRLYISGDISFDNIRQRTQSNRLEELCGVKFVSENYPSGSWTDMGKPEINVESTTARIAGNVFLNTIGKGEAHFSAAPFNASLLEMEARKSPQPAQQNGCHVMFVSESNNGGTFFAVNPDNTIKSTTVNYSGTNVEISLAGGKAGIVRFNKSGKLLAVESQGPVKVNGTEAYDVRGHFAISSLDGKDLRESLEVLVLPFGPGELRLPSQMSRLDVQRGEIVNGKWQQLGEIGRGVVNVSDATEFDLHIVASKARIPELGKQVSAEMMLK